MTKLGLTIRGTYGEGSEVTGALYQISNQITLGLSENEAIANLSSIASAAHRAGAQGPARSVRDHPLPGQSGPGSPGC